MSETVTAVPEIFSVAIHINYVPNVKVHLVAELFRHAGDRKYHVDTQVHKMGGVSRGCFDLTETVESCYTNAVGALTAPTTGRDLRVKAVDITNDEYGYNELANLVYMVSRRGRNSTTVTVEMWVEMI